MGVTFQIWGQGSYIPQADGQRVRHALPSSLPPAALTEEHDEAGDEEGGYLQTIVPA